MKEQGSQEKVNSDTITIPIGGLKKNPWILSTFILGIITIFLIAVSFKGNGFTGNSVSEKMASESLVNFINSQGNGNAEVVSTSAEDGFYKVTVSFQGQNIPVYVTMDGKYLVTNKVDLSNPSQANAGSGSEVTAGKKVKVEIGDSPKKGSESAKVVLVEFTDYQCPFCSRYYEQTYKNLIKDYVETGKVLIVIKDFPLNFHDQAQKAAESAHCAREQLGDDGYFKMHDKLFENQASLSVENEKKWAREIGLDGEKFDSCLDGGKYSEVVNKDVSYGSSLGVSGTPSFFVNGIPLSGALPYQSFKQLIDKELNG